MKNLLPIILILASVGAFFTYINPKYQDIKALQAERADYSVALDNSRELLARRDGLVKDYNMIPSEILTRLQKFLPDHVDNVRLIMDISGIAARYDLTLSNIKNLESGKKKETVGSIDIGKGETIGSAVLNFSVTAPYTTFQAFLADLERSLRVVDVVSLSFTADDKSEKYTYNLGIKTYWLK